MNVALVIIMGVAVVFFGLICIVLLCMAMSKIIAVFENGDSTVSDSAPVLTKGVPASPDPGPRGEVVAAVAAVLAEELGEDVSAIRILSLKKVN